MNKARILAAVLLLCWTPTASAQQVPPEQPPFRTGIELVTVDTTVLDRQGQAAARPAAAGLRRVRRRRAAPCGLRRVRGLDAWPAAHRLTATGRPVSTNEGARGGRTFVFVVDQNTLEPGSARQVAAAASGLFGRLTPGDRSALVVMPVGPKIELTWAHDRVRDELQRIGGLAHRDSWEGGSLAEARDIATQNTFALRQVAERECGSSGGAFAGGGAATSGGTQGSGGGGVGGGGGGGGGQGGGGGSSGGGAGGSGGGGGQGSAGGGGGGGGGGVSGFGASSGNQCLRNIQMQADMAWRSAQATSLTSLTALRQVLTTLAQFGGDKMLVLISGGLPLDERDQMSLLSTVAADAAAARTTLFTFFVPPSGVSATRRTMASSPSADERDPGLAARDAREHDRRRIVSSGCRRAVGLRAPHRRAGWLLPSRRRENTRRPGRQGTAAESGGVAGPHRRPRTCHLRRPHLRGPQQERAAECCGDGADAPATGLGLRITSYVAPDRDDPSRLKLVLAGEASRLANGEATFKVGLRDQQGREVISGEQHLGYRNRRSTALLGQRARLARHVHRAVRGHGQCRSRRLGRSPRGRIQSAARAAVRFRSAARAHARGPGRRAVGGPRRRRPERPTGPATRSRGCGRLARRHGRRVRDCLRRRRPGTRAVDRRTCR